MGRSRTSASEAPKPSEEPQAPSDAELAAAIAAILMGAIVVASAKETIKEILLLALAGASLPLEQLDDAARVGAEFATRGEGDAGSPVSGQTPNADENQLPQKGVGGTSQGDGDTGLLRGDASERPLGTGRSPLTRARFSNLLLRAHYALAATRRIAKDLRSGKTLGEAVLAEERFFTAHREANATRLSGAQFAAAAQAHFGDRVTWIHSGKEQFRPTHKRADGKQFNISSPPASTSGLPGTLPNCGCTFGPPIEGAPDLL